VLTSKSAQRDKESAWLRQNLRDAQSRSNAASNMSASNISASQSALASPGASSTDRTMQAAELQTSSADARRAQAPGSGASTRWLSKHEQVCSRLGLQGFLGVGFRGAG
jgi:hypothetical protein